MEANYGIRHRNEELKPGLIIFRRGDVDHRMWYCRMKMPKADRYKTVSLKTSDKEAARERAFDQDADVRFRIKHADRVLQGMAGWELPHPEVGVTRAKASKAAETHDKAKRGQHHRVGRPWKTPRNAGGPFLRNFYTGKPYLGINVLLLWSSAYNSPFWLTFKQAQALKGIRTLRKKTESLVIRPTPGPRA